MSRSSARISRPTCARCLAAALAAVVARPCFQCRARSLANPSGVFAPVDLPPCMRHRALLRTAGFLQGCPLRVFAPQRCPGQSGPRCQSRPASYCSVINISPLLRQRSMYRDDGWIDARSTAQTERSVDLGFASSKTLPVNSENLPTFQPPHTRETRAGVTVPVQRQKIPRQNTPIPPFYPPYR